MGNARGDLLFACNMERGEVEGCPPSAVTAATWPNVMSVLKCVCKCFEGGVKYGCDDDQSSSPYTSGAIYVLTYCPQWDLETAVRVAADQVAKLATFENNIQDSGIRIEESSPMYGQMIDFLPSDEAINNTKNAFIAMKASQQLASKYCLRFSEPEDCINYISSLPLEDTPLGKVCSDIYANINCNKEVKFRTIDGSCNNARAPAIGKSNTAYGRLLKASYEDGLYTIRSSSADGKELLSPRLISTSIDSQLVFDFTKTQAMAIWGLFVAYDMSYTPASNMVNIKTPIICCTNDGRPLPPRLNHISCAPISVPRSDPFYKKSFQSCMNYVRSLPAMRPDCTFGPTEQMNQASHFLDGSVLYGSTVKKMKSLRTKWGGRLITTLQKNGAEYPSIANPHKLPCHLMNSSECFNAGDIRINSQPQLSILHTLFLREHNRIADRLSTMNNHWDDERVFQESRKIVIAEIQHITYRHWLPRLLGRKFMSSIGLDSSPTAYDENVDPTINNEFATAAFPFIGSMIDSYVGLFKEDRNLSDVNYMKDHFVKTSQTSSVNYFDNVVRGMATQPSLKIDTTYTDALTHYWYTRSGEFGTDLLSLDIQRGRDHGIPAYVHFRKYCNLSEVLSFKDLGNVVVQPIIKRLESVYKKVQDIDLLVGGISELPAEDAMLGPTLQCIMGQQFLNSKIGDRFFYDNREQVNRFTEDQLEQIRRTSLARIFCDNSNNITQMQRDIFTPPSPSNELILCRETSIPFVNLNFWKEEKKT
ncbi:hypothetical protein V9T40_009195 [Parthenolecanium corni]|uniref:Peroxidase n=1 Tax=Parthenolecanium corni TaxID=536013 RepID=A0AAN9TZ70_9HEMI